MECKHPENSHVIDVHEGTIICTECAFVIDTYFHQMCDYKQEPNPVHLNLYRLAENYNFPKVIAEFACITYEKLKKIRQITNETYVREVFCFYNACREVGAPRCLWEIASQMGVSSTTLYQIDCKFSSKIKPIDPSTIVNRHLSLISEFSKIDIINIENLIKSLPIEMTQCLAPQSIVSGSVMHYCTITTKKISAKTIETIFHSNAKTLRTTTQRIANFFGCVVPTATE